MEVNSTISQKYETPKKIQAELSRTYDEFFFNENVSILIDDVVKKCENTKSVLETYKTVVVDYKFDNYISSRVAVFP